MSGLSEVMRSLAYGVPFPPKFASDSAVAMLASRMMSCLRIISPPSVRSITRPRVEGGGHGSLGRD